MPLFFEISRWYCPSQSSLTQLTKVRYDKQGVAGKYVQKWYLIPHEFYSRKASQKLYDFDPECKSNAHPGNGLTSGG